MLPVQELESLKESDRDPADRLWWRSKEALDLAFALETSLQMDVTAAYCLLLQDDIVLAPGFIHKVQQIMSQQAAAGTSIEALTLFSNSNGSKPIQVDRAQLWFGAVAFAYRLIWLEALPDMSVLALQSNQSMFYFVTFLTSAT